MVQDLVELGDGEIADGREPVHKPLVVRHHGENLGLLQHDFRDPNTVGRGVLLPGQVFAPVPVEPVEQCVGEPVQSELVFFA